MRALVCMFFLLLAGCDFSSLELQRTIMRGQVDWDTPDAVNLRKAIQACSFAGPEMDTACETRRAEAAILFSAIESCRNSDLPACQKINHHFDEIPFNGLADLAELFTLEWYLSLHAEDLNTLKPANELIWAFWGWDDVKAVLTDRFFRHRSLIVGGLYSVTVAVFAYFVWLIIQGRRKDENARLEAIAQAEVDRLDARMRQEEAARLENERLIEEARQLEEAARLKEMQEALLEKQRQLAEEARLAREQAERELAAENERAQKALEIALKDVTTRPKIRPNKRWATVRRTSDSQT